MKYKEFENAFSAARLNKYLYACNGNRSKALQLYRLNNKLCQKLYGVLNVFEVVLRNAIYGHYKAFFSDSDWILMKIKEFRNRIAHHEPICFDKAGLVDTTFVRTHYMLILRYLYFLGYNDREILYGLDVQPERILKNIDDLAGIRTRVV